MSKSQRAGTNIAKALRSFRGFLEGTGKASHTIASYHHDLQDFARFLEAQKRLEIAQITRKDLERYHELLKADGQKTNTRRRKLMTLRKFMEYMNRRSKTDVNVAKSFAAPAKLERVPHTFEVESFIEKIRALPTDSPLDRRNRCLFWLMAETGVSVSEVSRLRWSAIDRKGAQLEILGKNERRIPLSKALLSELLALQGSADSDRPCFLGYNRYGSLGGAMSPRGIELLVKSYSERLALGNFTPRNFRHSAAVQWFKDGIAPVEIRTRLGLKTDYSMRMYEPIFKKIESSKV